MKNFGTLYCYELKKLLTRKLAWAAVLALVVFCVIATLRAGNTGGRVYHDILDEDGAPLVVTGEQARREALEKAGSELNGRVMDEAFFQEMLKNVPDFSSREQQIVYFGLEGGAWSGPFSLAQGVFWTTGTVTAGSFYAEWQKNTQAYLDNYANASLSQGEKDYWGEKMAQIERPFVYRYPWPGTTKLMDFFYVLLGLLPVAAGICLCTVFSGEYRDRMDALLFTAKNSRRPLYFAKALAGAVVAVLAGVVIVGVTAAAHLAVWGWTGFDATLQMWQPVLPRPITVGQMLVSLLALLVLYTLVCGSISMLVSALTRSSVAALAVPVVLAQIMARFHQRPYGWKGYLPENLIAWDGPTNVQLVKVFGVYLDNLQFGTLLYLGIALVLLALCWLGWRRGAKW